MKLDKETKEVLNIGRMVHDTVHSEGWDILEEHLLEGLSSMNSVVNITETDPNKILQEIGARQLATTVITRWLQHVKGVANQYEANKEAVILQDDLIIRIENTV